MVARKPAVAGRFYPRDPRELAEAVHRFTMISPLTLSLPKALIVPHAGYVYSGAVAGQAYALLNPLRSIIHRVVLIGPSHYVSFSGIATSKADAFETPLGPIPIDQEINRRLQSLPFVFPSDGVHKSEHSLEVQLPFLTETLDKFSLVPLVYGRTTPQEIAECLQVVWDDPETLIVVSSDLSHFLDDQTCSRLDRETAGIIESLRTSELSAERACGVLGIQGLMLLAEEHHFKLKTLELSNSANTSGDRERVVGYGSFLMES